MYKLLVYTFLCFSAAGPAQAQRTNTLYFHWPMDLKQQSTGGSSYMKNNSKSLLFGNNTEKKSLLNSVGEIRSTIHHEAIFCRMEDALHQHLNIWVKFRMGTEDKYSD